MQGGHRARRRTIQREFTDQLKAAGHEGLRSCFGQLDFSAVRTSALFDAGGHSSGDDDDDDDDGDGDDGAEEAEEANDDEGHEDMVGGNQVLGNSKVLLTGPAPPINHLLCVTTRAWA